MIERTIPTTHLSYDDRLGPFEALPAHIQAEIQARVQYGLWTAASFVEPFGSDTNLNGYLPKEVFISIVAQDTPADREDLLVTNQYSIGHKDVQIVVAYTDPEDGSSGSYIYRNPVDGQLEHWM